MTTDAQPKPALTLVELNSDLDALQRLPASTLSKLIDPTAASPPRPANATTQLAAFNSNSGPADSLALTTAYASEMRDGAARLKAQEIGGPASAIAGGHGAAADLAKLERIRNVAEEVREAVDEYAKRGK